MEEQKRKFRISWKCFLFLIALFITVVNPCFGTEDPAKFPSKPITMIVAWAPGGSGDLSTRKLSDVASRILGQPIVVINKPGAAGVTGAILLSKADPDGYTLAMATWSPFVIVPHIREVSYNTKEDFTWIMQYAEVCHTFFVLSNSPWKTFKEFVEDARKNPGKLKYSTPGPLSGQTVLMEMVFSKEKVKVTFVPVGGGAEGDTKLLGGHIDAMVSTSLFPHLKEGRVRALMHAQIKQRFESFPDIPTHHELGYEFDSPNWYGIFAPKGVDPRIVKKLCDAYKKACEDPSFKEFMAQIYHRVFFRDSESFKALVFKDFDDQGKALKELIDLGLIKK
jgi:tripartite-type tricarboxylate transporter receptor subunit TctC